MRRLRPVYKFKWFSHHALADNAQGIHDAMDGNMTFPLPPLSMPDFQNAIDTMRVCITKWGPQGNRGSKADYVALLDARLVIVEMIRALGSYVDGIAAGSESIILSAGMVPSRIPAPFGVLEAPQNVRTLFSKHTPDSWYRLRWKKVNGAKSYNVFVGIDSSPENRVYLNTVRNTIAAFEIANCPSSTLRYFWIQAVGGEKGLGNFSDVCAARNK